MPGISSSAAGPRWTYNNSNHQVRGLRLRQGTTLTIKDGATWVQDLSDNPAGIRMGRVPLRPVRADSRRRHVPSHGRIQRPNGGGGNAIFGSYNDDNNQAQLGTLPPRANVDIKNGGRLENTGQLWFGTDGESSSNTRVSLTINDGHLDLTGGDIPIENGEMTGLGGVVGDLAFFYDHSEYLNPLVSRRHGLQNEEYEINFTVPVRSPSTAPASACFGSLRRVSSGSGRPIGLAEMFRSPTRTSGTREFSKPTA